MKSSVVLRILSLFKKMFKLYTTRKVYLLLWKSWNYLRSKTTHTHTHTQEKNKQTHIILSISEFESGVIILKEIRQIWIFFKENYENKKKIVFLFPLFFLALLGIYFSLPASHVLYYLLRHFSCVQFFVTPWTVAHQPPLSMGFSSQQ